MKYFKLYEQWMESGELPLRGLCACLGREANDNMPSIEWFKPSREDFPEFYRSMHISGGWWGYDGEPHESYKVNQQYEFTPFRQTILLFLAAMHDEI